VSEGAGGPEMLRRPRPAAPERTPRALAAAPAYCRGWTRCRRRRGALRGRVQPNSIQILEPRSRSLARCTLSALWMATEFALIIVVK